MKATLACAVAAACLLAGTVEAASVLTFETTTALLNAGYGDRMSETPNVEVSFGPEVSHPTIWSQGGYGDLNYVLEPEHDNWGEIEVTFTADPGYVVHLHSFDMAAWGGSSYILSVLRVRDGNGQVLVNYDGATILNTVGGVPTHSAFTPNVSGSVLKIFFNSSSLGGESDNIGISNIAFSQGIVPPPQSDVAAVPTPAAAVGALPLLCGLMAARRRRA